MLPYMKHIYLLMAIGLGLGGMILGGCSAYKPLRIQPIAADSAVIEPDFTVSNYTVDRDQNLYFYMSRQTIDRTTGEPLEQVAVMRVFWQPIGGRTSLNPSSINATFRYVVMTPRSAGLYEGAGFVRIYSTAGSGVMLARIVDGDLRLSESTKDFHDDLGRAVFTGNFSASLDNDTSGQILATQRTFFQRSLDASAGRVPPPATLPAATEPGAR